MQLHILLKYILDLQNEGYIVKFFSVARFWARTDYSIQIKFRSPIFLETQYAYAITPELRSFLSRILLFRVRNT